MQIQQQRNMLRYNNANVSHDEEIGNVFSNVDIKGMKQLIGDEIDKQWN